MRRIGGRAALHPELDRSVRRRRDAAARPRAPRRCCRPARRTPSCATSGSGRSRCWRPATWATTPARSPAHGFAFEMVVRARGAAHRDGPPGAPDAAARRVRAGGAAAAAAAARRRRAAGWRCGRRSSAWAPTGPGFAYDCERPCHVRAVAGVPDGARPGHQRRAPRVRRGRRLPPPRAVDRRRLGVAGGRGRGGPALLGARRRGRLARAVVRPRGAARPRRCRSAT